MNYELREWKLSDTVSLTKNANKIKNVYLL